MPGTILRVNSEDCFKALYDEVPADKEYLIKLIDDGKTLVNFSYILKKGKILPYAPSSLVGKENWNLM